MECAEDIVDTREHRSRVQDRVAQLTELAQYFARQQHYHAAAELFALALQLDPSHAEARYHLDAVRRAQRQTPNGMEGHSLRDAAWEEFRTSAVDGAHFVGLARLYTRKREFLRALECLEIAETKAPADPEPAKLKGRLLYSRGELERAAEALSRSLELNPFDRDAAEALGLVEYRRRCLPQAASATAHAFLLLGEMDSDEAIRLRGRLMTLKRLLRWQARDFQRLFRERRKLLHGAFDRLEWHREHFFEEESLPRGGALFGAPPMHRRGGILELATRLRKARTWRSLSDEHLFQLTVTMQEEIHERGSLVFSHEAPGRDLYIVEQGEVHIERPSPYGTFNLRTMGPGSVFGEVGYLSDQNRAGDAVAGRACRLVRVDAKELDLLLETNLELAGQFLWCLWHSLASKLRASNDELRKIFQAGSAPVDETAMPRLWHNPHGEQVELAPEVKRDFWREAIPEQVLSQRELITLATFSRERRFAAGEHLFREGEEGDELYAVVDGRVLISKYIPGGGEEALAILERGEFFGEMALLDGKPRSADARAEGGPVTVLALDQETVKDLFTLDAAASLEFIRLLCRLLTRRLRQIDEKVIGWRIMAGQWTERESSRAVG